METFVSPSFRIGVLYGGISPEYDLSLKSGAYAIELLSSQYRVEGIFIDSRGRWHLKGVEISPEQVLVGIDVFVNALHGGEGEDGTITKILKAHNRSFTGSGPHASRSSLHKQMAKEYFKNVGLRIPRHRLINILRDDADEIGRDIVRNFTFPIIVKPSDRGSSHGISVPRIYADIPDSIAAAGVYSPYVLVEEYIRGIPVTCGVIEDFRGQEIYSLLPLEIPHDGHYLDYSKRDTFSYRIPAHIPSSARKEIEGMAKVAHQALGLSHYSRSDFIYSPTRGVYLLETNALPDISEDSPFMHSLDAVGADRFGFLKHIISLA